MISFLCILYQTVKRKKRIMYYQYFHFHWNLIVIFDFVSNNVHISTVFNFCPVFDFSGTWNSWYSHKISFLIPHSRKGMHNLKMVTCQHQAILECIYQLNCCIRLWISHEKLQKYIILAHWLWIVTGLFVWFHLDTNMYLRSCTNLDILFWKMCRNLIPIWSHKLMCFPHNSTII